MNIWCRVCIYVYCKEGEIKQFFKQLKNIYLIESWGKKYLKKRMRKIQINWTFNTKSKYHPIDRNLKLIPVSTFKPSIVLVITKNNNKNTVKWRTIFQNTLNVNWNRYFQKLKNNETMEFKLMILLTVLNQVKRKYGWYQECKARKVNCGRVYSAYILKPVLSGRNL